MAQFDLKNAIVKILDGTTPTPLEITIKLGEGTLSYTEHKARQYYLDRGRLSDVRNADEQPVDVKFDATWEMITGSGDTEITIEDALKRRNNAADWVSTDADPCNPYCVDIVVVYTPPCTTVDGETITLPDFRYEQIDHDTKAGTFSLTGKCNVVEASSERVSQSS